MDETLKVQKLGPDARMPRLSPGSVGYDLFSTEDCFLKPLERQLVSTQIAIQIPSGCYGRIAPRSGLAMKQGIDIMAGVIDPDYTGEIKVLVVNLSDESQLLEQGSRIAQLILERCTITELEKVSKLDTTERGEKGFGSSGIR